MPFKENLLLSQEILSIIKKEVTSSTDMIPMHKLPHFFIGEVGNYIQTFGLETVSNYISLLERLKRARDLASNLFPQVFIKSTPSPISTRDLAITFCGVGECGETSNRAVFELMKAGCSDPINMVMITGERNSSSLTYSHVFLIIGDISHLGHEVSLGCLEKLRSDCVLFDPFFSRVETAQRTTAFLSTIFNIHKIDKVHVECFIPPFSVNDYDLILKNAQKLSLLVMQELVQVQMERSKQFNHGAQTYTSRHPHALFQPTPDSAHDALLQKINQHPQAKSRYSSVLEAITAKKYDLALRTACAHALDEAVPMLILEYADALQINVEAASSNGKAPLHWILSNQKLNGNAAGQAITTRIIDVISSRRESIVSARAGG